MNNLVKKEDKEAWNKIREDTKDHYITKLLHTAEKGTVALTEAFKHSAELEIKTADVGKQRNRAFFSTALKFWKVLKMLPVAQIH